MDRWRIRTFGRGLLAAVVTTPLVVGMAAGVAAGPVGAGPAVTGPVTGGNGAVVLQTTAFDLGAVGYRQSEFLLTGTASSYVATGALESDGRWQVTPAGTAPYTTRIVVYRPASPARFNGSVIVEWLNVSAGLDVAPEWVVAHNELIREGYAWVGVSAQVVGVNATRAADPVRYADLAHPGDSFSYDIFAQAGLAIRRSAGRILGGLRPQAVLGEGESQSASRLTTYINAVHPVARAYDGFLVHSRFAGGAPLSQAPQADVPTPQVARFRTDLDVPLLVVQAETDVLALGSFAARQPDSPRFRLWEMAGTAHADHYIANIGAGDTGNGAAGVAAFDAMLDPPIGTPSFTCAVPINTGPMHYVMDTAQYALNRWVTAGIAPATAARLDVATSGPAPVFVLDEHGNVRGGVRTPAVDVPVATLSGLGQSGASFCFLFGTTVPFGAEKLATLYPSHAQFVARWAAATVASAVAGFIRSADAAELIAAAARSDVGR
jgi:hypothetical protein